jgi:biotin synthase-like enzyme
VAHRIIMMPKSLVRLSAGRIGANLIFVGDKLPMAANPEEHKDTVLFCRLGILAMEIGVI